LEAVTLDFTRLATRPADISTETVTAVNAPRVSFLRSLRKVDRFSEVFGGTRLRSYQLEAARAIVDSVLHRRGLSLVVMFPRQSGKNLLQAQLEVYLLALFAAEGAEIVKFSPTHDPQNLNAMRRLEAALEANYITRGRWKKSSGNHYRLNHAHMTFLSAAPGSNVVGATASTLLELDEAQDIEIGKYDKQIAAMAASTNATRVFWGTAWSGETLLARELRAAQAAEARDGRQRVFRVGAEEVRREVPAYGAFVDEQVTRLGRGNPIVRSQLFSEEIDLGSGLFNAARIGLMRGSHAPLAGSRSGFRYALLLDLAGEDESQRAGSASWGWQTNELANPGRDASALTVVEVVPSGLSGLPDKPRYKVVRRYLWVGEKHQTLYSRILALVEFWRAERLVVDASGVGAGVASFLADQLGRRVLPVVFNAAVKSKLGWDFLAVVDTGRFQDYSTVPAGEGPSLEPALAAEQQLLSELFLRQLAGISYSVSIGPEHHLSWGVPDGARDPQGGGALHDDLVLSAALCACLDGLPWAEAGTGGVVEAVDPLREMDGGY
jgi:hypothetical protein